MKKPLLSLFLILSIVLTGMTAWAAPEGEAEKIKELLVNFHDAAAKGDKKRYLSVFTKDAIFLGTDETEHWQVSKGLTDYVDSYFKEGKGWVYLPEKQFIYFSEEGKMAWFDEVAVSKTYGRLRGTGVFIMQQGEWKMAHYSLTFLIPNEKVKALMKIMNKKDKK